VAPVPGYAEMKNELSGETVYVSSEVLFRNQDIQAIRLDEGEAGRSFQIEFTAAAQPSLLQATNEHMGESLALLVDGVVLMAPVIRYPLKDGKILVAGFDTRGQAEKVVNRMVR
jgi:preprotein translocase subunit SecD